MKTIADSIYNRILKKGRGWVFTPFDFQDLGSRESIDQTLSRLAKKEKIRRVTQGVYDYPKISRFGEIPTSLMLVAKAIARSTQTKIQVSESYAANVLGLSNQVPAKIILYTDGTRRVRKVGKQKIIFKQATPKKLVGAGKMSGLVIQGLRYFGKDRINEKVINRLKDILKQRDKELLLKEKYATPIWMQSAINQIAGQV
ncbi:MAG: hypothetical protein SCARUB_02778 [Candidatus Scalindua rubra]|uniref:Transcriptional regulator, AbiEi antitoxin, Type IV TA system n=1 Tax=Candidatus Scalindua rubra TaxID=1872076 RepID=A0A1E3X4T4_9BACT|nr:MAG: hypothetical protein SCARUB_04913 [Candidatus Scalindua rubra]ODS32071.1 MAG: hypothetical protein SCARUB_02778 [Candidatus Scalindua rubra]